MNKKWLTVIAAVMGVGGAAYGASKYLGSKKAKTDETKEIAEGKPAKKPDELMKQLPCPSCGKPVRSYEFYCPFCGGGMEDAKKS